MTQKVLKKYIGRAYGCNYSDSMISMIFKNKGVRTYESIDSNEFVEEWLSKYDELQNKCLIKAFKYIDKNGSGLIDYQKLIKYLSKLELQHF